MVEYAEVNRKVYNKDKEKAFDLPIWKKVAEFLVMCLLKFHPDNIDTTRTSMELTADNYKTLFEQLPTFPAWISGNLKVLDFACGAGNITNHVKQFANEIVGIDISSDMVDAYKRRTGKRAYALDILTATKDQSELIGCDYDIVVCTLSYHHIENYELVTKKLVECLKKGGWLLVLDNDKDNHEDNVAKIFSSGHSHQHENSPGEVSRDRAELGVAHHGLKAADLQKIFENAGLENVAVQRNINFILSASQNDIAITTGNYQAVSTIPEESDENTLDVNMGVLVVAGQKA